MRTTVSTIVFVVGKTFYYLGLILRGRLVVTVERKDGATTVLDRGPREVEYAIANFDIRGSLNQESFLR